jgi:hypothetical protein
MTMRERMRYPEHLEHKEAGRYLWVHEVPRELRKGPVPDFLHHMFWAEIVVWRPEDTAKVVNFIGDRPLSEQAKARLRGASAP